MDELSWPHCSGGVLAGAATAKKFPGALREAFENPILRAAEKQGTDTLDAPNEVSTKMCKHLE